MELAKLELACFNVESVKCAIQCGVDRIEFAHNYEVGGITPYLSDFKIIRKLTKIPIYVMIRCRPGNFIYSRQEIETMKISIQSFLEYGADGIVFGCLTTDNRIDEASNHELIMASNGVGKTFHRAFDQIINWEEGIEQLIKLKFQNLLSSGGLKAAMDGIEKLDRIKKISNNRLNLIVGGGIRSNNILNLKKRLGNTFYHSACITNNETQIASQTEIFEILNKIRK